MADLPTEVTYSTFTEFTANTRVAAQTGIDENTDWKPIALHAEYLIDAYVNCVKRFEDDQVRKFPITNDDGVSEIPIEVKKAHIELVSHLLLEGEPSASDEAVTGKKVSAESWASTGYSKAYARSDKEKNQSGAIKMPPIVVSLLAQWYTKSAQLKY
jgi:hypothetical protein